MAGSIISKMAFVPPQPATYDESLLGLFCARDNIACVMHPMGLPYGTTILYSHGNAEDLGAVREYMMILSDRLSVNMVSYDYEGYGLSGGGIPTESGTYSAAQGVYTHLTDVLHVKPSRLILMGRSLGSGPAIHLATITQRCAGLILVSPFTSAARVVLRESAAVLLSYVDIFVNIKKIDKVSCPVLILHGVDDEIVPYRHGVELANACPSLWKMVSIPGGTHNNFKTTIGICEDIKDFLDCSLAPTPASRW